VNVIQEPRAAAGTIPARDTTPAPADVSERGRTTVSGRAVERIAVRLIDECPEAGGTARRILGVSAGQAARESADVTARLHGTSAVSLAVRCSVPYPRPVARATAALREILTTRLAELTGLTVQRIDITVTELTSAGTGRRVE
jgi:uncharacterized alkaline shock family protein YloU